MPASVRKKGKITKLAEKLLNIDLKPKKSIKINGNKSGRIPLTSLDVYRPR